MVTAGDVIYPLIKALNLPNVSVLEAALDMYSYPIAKLIKRNAPLTMKIAQKIIEKYPDVNPAFLVTGKGPVLMDDTMKRLLGFQL
jgi:hypothetical protein